MKLLTFPETLKHAGITPLYQKGKKVIKGKYGPVSIFPNLSKIFEKCIFEQMSQFFENIFGNIHMGFGGFQYPAMSSDNVRKMDKVCQ